MKQMVATEQIAGIKTDQQTIDLINQAIASGQIQAGEKLYLHIITFYRSPAVTGGLDKIRVYIIKNDDTQFDFESLRGYLGDKGFTSSGKALNVIASPYISSSSTMLYFDLRLYKDGNNLGLVWSQLTPTLNDGTITFSGGLGSSTIISSQFKIVSAQSFIIEL